MRRPRILFLADRNNLADQAYNSFSAFPNDAVTRIDPETIRKKDGVTRTTVSTSSLNCQSEATIRTGWKTSASS